ncbi:hypothetical protein ABPG72_009556 [Tetrahymena utriculariae]
MNQYKKQVAFPHTFRQVLKHFWKWMSEKQKRSIIFQIFYNQLTTIIYIKLIMYSICIMIRIICCQQLISLKFRSSNLSGSRLLYQISKLSISQMEECFFSPPPPYSEIIKPSLKGDGGLYLGSIEIAENYDKLKKLRIGAIVSIIGYPLQLNYDNKIKHLYLEAYDREDQNIEQFFDASYEFISENIKKTNVFVHCQLGISRSSSIVIAYLMMSKQTTFLKELQFVKFKRDCAHPNDSFQKQLMNLEQKLTKKR